MCDNNRGIQEYEQMLEDVEGRNELSPTEDKFVEEMFSVPSYGWGSAAKKTLERIWNRIYQIEASE